MFNQINFSEKKGFSLIELVVVLTLFMIIVGTTISIFIYTIQHQKTILEEQEIVNQVGYVLEYIGKALRTAVKNNGITCINQGMVYWLSQNEAPNDPYEKIKFIRYDGVCYEIFFDHTAGFLKEIKDGGASQNILAGKFTIEDVGFIANGNKTESGIYTPGSPQPRITIVIKVKTLTGQKEKTFQTTVSLINFDQ